MANEVMCPYCGEMISEKATVCRHCGRMLTGSVNYDADGTGVWYGDAPDGHTGEEAQRMRRRSRGVLWLVIALCVLLVAAFIGIFTYLAFDLTREVVGHQDSDIDSIIADITESNPTDPDDLDDIDEIPELLDGVLPDQMTLVMDYVSALEQNDPAAAAKLFHPAILEMYDGNAEEMLSDLDEHFSAYGTELSGWKTVETETVDAESLEELNASLPVGIEAGEMYLLELTPRSGGAVDVFLLLVQTEGAWSLYYSY